MHQGYLSVVCVKPQKFARFLFSQLILLGLLIMGGIKELGQCCTVVRALYEELGDQSLNSHSATDTCMGDLGTATGSQPNLLHRAVMRLKMEGENHLRRPEFPQRKGGENM